MKNFEANHGKLKINNNLIQDVYNIANEVYYPLKGFLRKKDYQSVLDNMHLENGEVWSIPIVLDISREDKKRFKNEDDIILVDENNNNVAWLKNIEIYSYNKKEFAYKVFGTEDLAHPGVKDIDNMENYFIGGRIILINDKSKEYFKYYLTPEETKKIFKNKGWEKVVAFQTRNIPHLGHEFLQKEALKEVDGLFIHPVVGEKKQGDFKSEFIIIAYEILINKYFLKNKVSLGELPLKMRYAGPREALMHALIRRNFGCTHFIVGRDHAGVANYYKPKASQEIFNNFDQKKIGIKVLKYDEVVYNKLYKKHCFINDCPVDDAISFSGTKIRENIRNKQRLPDYFVRKEIYSFLINFNNLLIDNMQEKNKKGFVLWFTGLSAAGKTTIADEVYRVLNKEKNILERIDGDIARRHLTKGLGFSKKDRDENIKRIGEAVQLLSRNETGVIASFITPYKKQRKELRDKINNFIEVFVDASLSTCETRDPKGMYKKARAGEIKNFTGISDPYEIPKNPDIHLKTDQMTIDACVGKVIDYLKENNYIN